MIKFCIKCGAKIDDNTSFCIKCGTKVKKGKKDENKICSNCSAQILDNSLFCIKCGADLMKAKTNKKVEKSTNQPLTNTPIQPIQQTSGFNMFNQSANVNNTQMLTPLLIITAILSIIAAIIVFVSDFGEAAEYYTYVRETYYINATNGAVGVLVILLGVLFLICTLIAVYGIIDIKSLTKMKVNLGIILPIIIILISVIGSAIGASIADDYWLGVGFFGAVIGGFIIMSLYIFIRICCGKTLT